MKKSFARIIALGAMLLAVCVFASACLMGGTTAQQQQPQVDYVDKVPTDNGRIALKLGGEKITVNTDAVIGYFHFEGDDSSAVMLTDKEYETTVPVADESGNAQMDENGNPLTKTETRKNITELTVTVLDSNGNPVDPSKYTVEIITEDKLNDKLKDQKSRLEKYVGYLYISCEEIGTVEISAKGAGSETEPAKITVVRQSLGVWDIIMLGVGLYLLFCGITGKGRLYESDFIKEGKEEKHKLIVRLTCLIAAMLMIGTGVLAALDGYGKLRWINYILFGAMIVVFVAALLLLRSCTDREAKRKAQASGTPGHAPSSPNAAFIFDDDEPTVDDLKVNNRKDQE